MNAGTGPASEAVGMLQREIDRLHAEKDEAQRQEGMAAAGERRAKRRASEVAKELRAMRRFDSSRAREQAERLDALADRLEDADPKGES